ncbi:MAG TPA: OmpA family protein [Polyangia bacterium]
MSVALLVAAGFGGACAHEPPAAVTPPRVVRRPPPAPRPEPKVAASEAPSLAEVAPASSGTPAIFFDFDSALLRDEAQPELQRVAATMRARREATLRVEGNCDRLGTVEYNLALGEHRAEAAKQYLVRIGVPTGRITTVSYGSERPKYDGASEDERAKNRRDDLVIR